MVKLEEIRMKGKTETTIPFRVIEESKIHSRIEAAELALKKQFRDKVNSPRWWERQEWVRADYTMSSGTAWIEKRSRFCREGVSPMGVISLIYRLWMLYEEGSICEMNIVLLNCWKKP
jgi:hypothetical protein